MAKKTLGVYTPINQNQKDSGIEYKTKIEYDPKSGDTTLCFYTVTTFIGGITPPQVSPTCNQIYKNGVWNSNSFPITEASEKNQVNEQVKSLVLPLKGVPGNVIPGFVTQNAPSQDQGQSGITTVSQDTGGIIGDILNFLGPITDINTSEYGTDMSKLFPTPLKYPIDLIENGQDVLSITQFTYKSPYKEVFENKQFNTISKAGVQRKGALLGKIQTVTLPMPNTPSDINSVDWGSGNMDPFAMAAAGNVGGVAGTLGTLAATKAVGGIVEALGRSPTTIALGGLASSINVKALSQILTMNQLGFLNSPAFKPALQSLILNAAGFDIPPETILSRGYGVIANSNVELLFTGVKIRGFQFMYIMSPRSEKEAIMCRNIIRFFKQGMAARKKDSASGYGGASFLLATPNVFKLSYKVYNSASKKYEENPSLNKFKICALTDMNVTYSDGQWSAYEKGQPTYMGITLTFKELEPIYESDYQEKPAPNFSNETAYAQENQSPVFKDDVGY